MDANRSCTVKTLNIMDANINGFTVTDSSFISAVAQVGLRVPTPHAEEFLSVHLRVPSPALGGCVALAQGPT